MSGLRVEDIVDAQMREWERVGINLQEPDLRDTLLGLVRDARAPLEARVAALEAALSTCGDYIVGLGLPCGTRLVWETEYLALLDLIDRLVTKPHGWLAALTQPAPAEGTTMTPDPVDTLRARCPTCGYPDPKHSPSCPENLTEIARKPLEARIAALTKEREEAEVAFTETLRQHAASPAHHYTLDDCRAALAPDASASGGPSRASGGGGVMDGAERIAAERQRQIDVEGYTAEHDYGHADELLRAARCYAAAADNVLHGERPAQISPRDWPWAPRYWKPTGDPVRDMEKAGALIAAAIDALAQPAPAEEVGRYCEHGFTADCPKCPL